MNIQASFINIIYLENIYFWLLNLFEICIQVYNNTNKNWAISTDENVNSIISAIEEEKKAF